MTLTLDGIPDKEDVPENAEPTRALTRVKAGRRSVLRGVALGAMTLGAVTVNWTNKFTAAPAYAESGPGGVQGWDRTDCQDAYPGGYNEKKDTGGAYVNNTGACWGATYIASTYCSAGWHRTDTVHDSPVTYYYQ